MPAVRLFGVSVATPEDSVAVPIVASPSTKVMVPVAVKGVTVAVSVVFWPNVEGIDGRSEDDRSGNLRVSC